LCRGKGGSQEQGEENEAFHDRGSGSLAERGSIRQSEIARPRGKPGASSPMLSRLLVLFIAVPLVEMFLFLQVGQWIGTFPTIAMVVVTGFFGAWLTKTQGLRVINRFRSALAQEGFRNRKSSKGFSYSWRA